MAAKSEEHDKQNWKIMIAFLFKNVYPFLTVSTCLEILCQETYYFYMYPFFVLIQQTPVSSTPSFYI